MALILAKKGKIPEALRGFQKVLGLDSKNTFARLWAGILWLKRVPTTFRTKVAETLFNQIMSYRR